MTQYAARPFAVANRPAQPPRPNASAGALAAIPPAPAADDWTILVRQRLLRPMAERLGVGQAELDAQTQHWARALAEAGCQNHELVGIRQALAVKQAKLPGHALTPADGIAAMQSLRRNGQALAALPKGGARYPRGTRQRRLAALYGHLAERAKQQNVGLFSEKRGKLWQARLTQALDQAARQTAERETLIAGLDAFADLPEADAVEAVLLTDGWHFAIRPETLADWRRRLPRLA